MGHEAFRWENMTQFIPGNTALVFPRGTTVAHSEPTWAMYINRALNLTWIGYKVPGGTRLLKMPGIRSRISSDFAGIQAFVQQKQATACGACGD